MHGSLKEVSGHKISKVAMEDLPWLLSLASKRYRHFDPGSTLVWLVNTIRNEHMQIIRTTDAFCISTIQIPAWHPEEPECHVIFICAAAGAHWQAMSLLREAVRWARSRNCLRFWISSETENRVDSLAKRLGAEPAVMRFKLDLRYG